jgi:hypothetical protein
MKVLVLLRCGLAVAVSISSLCGCGGSRFGLEPVEPYGQDAVHPFTLGAMNHLAKAPRVARQGSWMAPEAKRQNLLYISDAKAKAVYVYSYPQGKAVGTLTGFNEPGGECVDRSGDVWIANTGGLQILEYAHGGTSPIASLGPNLDFGPLGCSVDPTTGDLAVTNVCGGRACLGNGILSIYAKAKGRPKNYLDPTIYEYYFCAYDDDGDLFLDGLTAGEPFYDFAFAELASGKKNLKNILLNQSFFAPGGVAWDGTHIAVADGDGSYIYQFTIKGANGIEVGNTPLPGQSRIEQFWIQRPTVVVPGVNSYAPDVTFRKYPHGGWPQKTITGLENPIGAVVSPSK